MNELILPLKVKNNIQNFIQGLVAIYRDNLVSVILYGSAASGEFIDKHSNLNLLVVLRDAGIDKLKAASSHLNKFKEIKPLFFTESYIYNSLDVFPIEFLDMQENYFLLYGSDVLKDIKIDTANLRFQCEQELKAKLINLKHIYLTAARNKNILSKLLFKSFTSVLHILRNCLRLKNITPPYKKEDILEELSYEYKFDLEAWKKILSAKNKKIRLSLQQIDELFVNFVKDLETIVDTVDSL
jgi:predicted nucleotidyltransferase